MMSKRFAFALLTVSVAVVVFIATVPAMAQSSGGAMGSGQPATGGAPVGQAGATPVTQPSLEMPIAASSQPTPASRDLVDQIKQPVPWFSWGFDERWRQEYLNNAFSLRESDPNREWTYQRYRTRLWGTLTPIKDTLDINMRLTWESRYWWQPEDVPARTDYVANNMVIDNINFKLKNPGGIPLTLTVGRQDIILGDGWLVLDGTPNDGSRTIFFDAIRATFDLKDCKTTADVIYIQNYANANKYWPPEDTKDFTIEQDEKGAIVWVANKSIKDTEIDGYFIYKHNTPVLANADDGDIYTFGARGVHNIGEHWLAKAEGALQFGNQKTLYPKFSPAFGTQQSIWAGGANTSLAYLFKDKWNNQLQTGYEFLSGDRADTKNTYEAFNPLWGRWPQWSELMVYVYAPEERIANITNLHRIWYGWQADPTQKLQLQVRYNLLFSDRNTFEQTNPGRFGGGCFRGQCVTAIARYKFNRFLSGHLQAEWFKPDGYYAPDRNDNALFLRAELVFAL